MAGDVSGGEVAQVVAPALGDLSQVVNLDALTLGDDLAAEVAAPKVSGDDLLAYALPCASADAHSGLAVGLTPTLPLMLGAVGTGRGLAASSAGPEDRAQEEPCPSLGSGRPSLGTSPS